MNSVITPLRVQALFRCAIALVILSPLSVFSAPSGARHRFESSVRGLPAAAALDASDQERQIEFLIPLRLRNYDELLLRVANGETIKPLEMETRYYPLAADYDALINWVNAQGLTLMKTDPNRMGVFVSGKVYQVSQALQVEFGKVSSENRTFVSATTAPSLPASLAPMVLGVDGLQPHIHPRKHSHRIETRSPRFNSEPTPQIANQAPYLVNEIRKAYDADALQETGAGEKIAIVIDTFPKTTDLTTFWSLNAINQSLNNIEFIQVVSGTLPTPSGEESLDVEWSSGIATGAKVRVYAVTETSFVNVDQAFQAIISDLPSQPELHEVSISLGAGESQVAPAQLETDRQYFATMAAQNLTVFVSSGDEGSDTGGFLQVSYFASDPSVTAVGGTSLFLSTCSGVTLSESAWSGSGGGVSGVFDRPAWQVGTGVPAGTKRLVPDVASAADPNTGSLVILNGALVQFGGTSWSAPMWAGFGAMINEARQRVGLGPLGLLGPHIYPFLGTVAFQDITSGDNGAFSATIGYDLATGLGVPNVAALKMALTGGPQPGPAPVPGATPIGAQILIPDSTCPLPASSVTFQWTTGGSTAYLFTIGSSFGASDIFSSGQTGGTFETVSNLPSDGRTLFIRLWSSANGVWLNPPQDVVYTSAVGAVGAPIIAPGGGTFKKKVKVNMASITPQAAIFYTLDGSTPTTMSTPFHSPFTITATATLKAKAFKTGVPDSAVSSASFVISKKASRSR
jgi:kumamolisin